MATLSTIKKCVVKARTTFVAELETNIKKVLDTFVPMNTDENCEEWETIMFSKVILSATSKVTSIGTIETRTNLISGLEYDRKRGHLWWFGEIDGERHFVLGVSDTALMEIFNEVVHIAREHGVK